MFLGLPPLPKDGQSPKVERVEGLEIHALLRELEKSLPCRTLGWTFPHAGSAVLVLDGKKQLELGYQPPEPRFLIRAQGEGGDPVTPFQRLLRARVKGRLLRVQQPKLDRVAMLDFEGSQGFVSAPPTRLVFELTGRNANLIICDQKGTIIALDRPVGKDINRFRELRLGLPYQPPPPYQKLDPRNATIEDLRALLGKPLGKAIQEHLDGIGKKLALELAHRAGLGLGLLVMPEHLPLIQQALVRLVENPAVSAETSVEPGLGYEPKEAVLLRASLRKELERKLRTLAARLQDYQKAREQLPKAAKFREYGDLLMAYGSQVEAGAKLAQLHGFDGNPVEIPLDASLTAIQNAEKYYARARRIQENAQRSQILEPKISNEIAELAAGLETTSPHGLSEALAPLSPGELRALAPVKQKRAKAPGLEFESPGGFKALVGRSAKENDKITRAAHSQDLWFHAQGVPGSHVILRTQGKPAPLPDLLFAAKLAAYYSKAKGEKNLPVDYTQKKYLWRPRKAEPGQVLYSEEKTLFVDAELPEELSAP